MLELLAYPILLLLFTALFTLEVIAPASKNNCDKRWLILASAIGLAQMVVSLFVGYWLKDAFQANALIQVGDILPSWLSGLLAFFIASFIFYWWHRWTHQSDLLWRLVHQLHHSATRIESITAFYAHPLDSAMATLISCLSAYLVLGTGPEAAAWAVLFTGLFNFYVHSDTRSPRWVGYFIQRPEMHRQHHKYGLHADNYGLPIWDWLFGTYHNPNQEIGRFGFDQKRSEQVFDMLKGIDVHKKKSH